MLLYIASQRGGHKTPGINYLLDRYLIFRSIFRFFKLVPGLFTEALFQSILSTDYPNPPGQGLNYG